MLVLGRRLGQSIVIDLGPDSVRVRLLRIRGKEVRLGVTAPERIKVLREEINDCEGNGPAEISRGVDAAERGRSE